MVICPTFRNNNTKRKFHLFLQILSRDWDTQRILWLSPSGQGRILRAWQQRKVWWLGTTCFNARVCQLWKVKSLSFHCAFLLVISTDRGAWVELSISPIIIRQNALNIWCRSTLHWSWKWCEWLSFLQFCSQLSPLTAPAANQDEMPPRFVRRDRL